MIRSLAMLALAALLACPAAAQDVRLRAGGAEARVSAGEGMQPHVFARRLGDISDMVQGSDGTVYAADQTTGRIFRIADRGRDGRADSQSSLAHRFDMPSGLAVDGRTLFVADRSGLWVLEPTGTPRLLAPFARAGATDAPHPILLRPDGQVLLALSKPDGTATLLSVDRRTGRATQIDSGPGEIVGFAEIPGLDMPIDPDTEDLFPRIRTPWMVVRVGDRTQLHRAQSGGMAADGADARGVLSVLMNPEKGPAMIGTDAGLFWAESSLTGVSIGDGHLLRGVRADHLVVDSQRLLVADRKSGTVWAVLPEEETPQPPEPEPQADPLDVPPEDLLLRGSGIDSASTLQPGATPSDAPRDAQDDSE